MKVLTIRSAQSLRRLRAFVAVLVCASAAACQHNKHPGPYIRPDPIEIHVQSENFLDANIYIDVGGVAQRLGTVIGNGKANFTYPWNNSLATGLVMVATTIGGAGSARSVSLSVNPGQIIDFRITPELRQTYATVRNP